jgi:hypothetical protein
MNNEEERISFLNGRIGNALLNLEKSVPEERYVYIGIAVAFCSHLVEILKCRSSTECRDKYLADAEMTMSSLLRIQEEDESFQKFLVWYEKNKDDKS